MYFNEENEQMIKTIPLPDCPPFRLYYVPPLLH